MTNSPKRLTDEEFDRETAWAQRQLEGGCDYPLWLEEEARRARASEKAKHEEMLVLTAQIADQRDAALDALEEWADLDPLAMNVAELTRRADRLTLRARDLLKKAGR